MYIYGVMRVSVRGRGGRGGGERGEEGKGERGVGFEERGRKGGRGG